MLHLDFESKQIPFGNGRKKSKNNGKSVSRRGRKGFAKVAKGVGVN
jgi:hypothetical protein